MLLRGVSPSAGCFLPQPGEVLPPQPVAVFFPPSPAFSIRPGAFFFPSSFVTLCFLSPRPSLSLLLGPLIRPHHHFQKLSFRRLRGLFPLVKRTFSSTLSALRDLPRTSYYPSGIFSLLHPRYPELFRLGRSWKPGLLVSFGPLLSKHTLPLFPLVVLVSPLPLLRLTITPGESCFSTPV